MAKVFYLWVETRSISRSAEISVDSQELQTIWQE
jgi:hypothetical protein